MPFLDKDFLDVAMSIDPNEKMFGKGESQNFDEDGFPRMEKANDLKHSQQGFSLIPYSSVYNTQGFRQFFGRQSAFLIPIKEDHFYA